MSPPHAPHNQQKVTLASGRPLIALARGNPRLAKIDVAGTSVGSEVAGRIAAEIRAHAAWRAEQRLAADP
eukprot:gene2992-17331_t